MPHPSFDIAGQVVLITGAGRGLGAGLAVAFAAAGARVVLGDIDPQAAEATAAHLRAAGHEALGLPCDIRDVAAVEALCDAALAAFGRLDVLLNNAGVNVPKPAEELAPAEWEHVVGTNLSGTWHCCQAAGRIMLRQGTGCIITICSIHGHVGSYIHQAAAYNASKAALINLTRSLALEWGPRGVRVNGLSPGPLATELMTTRLANSEYVRKLMERMALRRIGTPADVAGAALFLASPAASWITGQILAVDGGWLAA
jgi:NAD(P)-dependent dehydrogenase (short-subunit alcohol dehydrogenase family)